MQDTLIFYLTIKSNSDPASINTPSRVDTAPSKMGANICSNARTVLRFLSPMAVRNAWKTMKFMPSDFSPFTFSQDAYIVVSTINKMGHSITNFRSLELERTEV